MGRDCRWCDFIFRKDLEGKCVGLSRIKSAPNVLSLDFTIECSPGIHKTIQIGWKGFHFITAELWNVLGAQTQTDDKYIQFYAGDNQVKKRNLLSKKMLYSYMRKDNGNIRKFYVFWENFWCCLKEKSPST